MTTLREQVKQIEADNPGVSDYELTNIIMEELGYRILPEDEPVERNRKRERARSLLRRSRQPDRVRGGYRKGAGKKKDVYTAPHKT